MKGLIISAVIMSSFTFSANAINVGEITTTINSNETWIAKEIKNTTEAARLVTVNIVKISSPMADGKTIPMETKKEIMSTPARAILTGNASENIRFFYNGPQDDKERYYQIQWTDDTISEGDDNHEKKSGIATTSAAINTILVVAPRKENFNFERKDNIIYNRGNVSFRVISIGPCKKKKSEKDNTCRERYNLMPGLGVKLQLVDVNSKESHIGIWHGEQYITVK